MDQVQGKHFSITDPQNVNTVIYQINKTEGLMEENTPKFTLERLKCREELVGLNKRKTFFVDAPKDEGNQLIILSFGQDRVVVNMGLLNKDEVKISKRGVENPDGRPWKRPWTKPTALSDGLRPPI